MFCRKKPVSYKEYFGLPLVIELRFRKNSIMTQDMITRRTSSHTVMPLWGFLFSKHLLELSSSYASLSFSSLSSLSYNSCTVFQLLLIRSEDRKSVLLLWLSLLTSVSFTQWDRSFLRPLHGVSSKLLYVFSLLLLSCLSFSRYIRLILVILTILFFRTTVFSLRHSL